MKIENVESAVKTAVLKARHAGLVSVPTTFGVRRDTGDPGKSGRFSLWRRLGQLDTRILSGIWCSGADADGAYLVDVPTRDGEKRYCI